MADDNSPRATFNSTQAALFCTSSPWPRRLLRATAACSLQCPLASHNIDHSPLANKRSEPVTHLVLGGCAAPWRPEQQHAWEEQQQFPIPLVPNDVLRQPQSIAKWSLEDRRTLLQLLWQHNRVQRQECGPRCRKPKRLCSVHRSSDTCLRTLESHLACIARRTRWNLSSWLSGESIAVATVRDDMSLTSCLQRS